MLKNILNLDGVKTLDKKEQTEINGGINCACIYWDTARAWWACC
ncbi:hypothetical protein IMCC3317_06380 [Kordia antarctica]|uniref:Uncharacterized protein n=1 Tax=Kordia antarctica TaxID=1218801 RepID=A0A7L4ZEZ5_9FLAO|nr:hypothetical protein [Kordia antarctica]QHI35292.1 hypothetical protein IMCC3317_06380 [Kordia antarctica]